VIRLVKVAVHIKDWGKIVCSESNIGWTIDREYLNIRTNAIFLNVPEEFVRIVRLGNV